MSIFIIVWSICKRVTGWLFLASHACASNKNLSLFLWSTTSHLLPPTFVMNNQTPPVVERFISVKKRSRQESLWSVHFLCLFLWRWDYVVMFFCHIPMTGWHFHLHRSRQTCWNWVPADSNHPRPATSLTLWGNFPSSGRRTADWKPSSVDRLLSTTGGQTLRVLLVNVLM